MAFEQLPKETALEHKDITGERRPKHSKEVASQTRAEFFFNLMDETLRNYDEARKANPAKEKSPLQNLEFFFKKSWDNFTEPVFEYEDMLAEIMTKKWESEGQKSRALNGLKERRAKALENIKVVMPDFEELDFGKQRKAIAKLYEGYAGFIHEKEKRFTELAEDINKGFDDYLRIFLRTERNEFLKKNMELMLIRKEGRKERRRASKNQEAVGEESRG